MNLSQNNSPHPDSSGTSPTPAPVQPTTYTSPSPKKPPRARRTNWRSVISTLLLLAIAPLIAFLITAFALQSYEVDGESMRNTLQNNDRLIVDKIPRTIARITGHDYIPHRGDIIIFNQANLPDASLGQTKQLIKRVVGLPGDRVVVKNGSVTIYNAQHPNGWRSNTNFDGPNGYKLTEGDNSWTIGKNQIFVMGDNRPNSEDSRYFGPVDANNIVGKLVLRVLPIDKAKSF